MKNNPIGSLIILLLIITNFGCQKDKIPVLSTNVVTAITATSAISGGTITDEGSGTIITRGVCWSTNITPTEADNKTLDGAGDWVRDRQYPFLFTLQKTIVNG